MNISCHAWVSRISIGAVILFSAFLVFSVVVQSSLLRDNKRSAIVHMVNGTAEVPYVQRVLLPTISNVVAGVASSSVKRGATKLLRQFLSHPFIQEMAKFSKWSYLRGSPSHPRYALHIIVVLGCMFAALAAYALTLRKLSQALFPGQPYLPEFTMFFGLLLATTLVSQHAKLYDFPGMALTALGLFALYRQRWRTYITIFVLACLNKENAMLLTGVFSLYYWKKMERRKFYDLIGVQFVLWGIIFYSLRSLYAHNEGVYYFHLFTLFAEELMHFSLSDFSILVVLGGLLFARWKEIPPLLKSGCLMIAGCAGTYFLFGKFKEYRVFYDCLPIVALIGSHTLYRMVMPPLRYQCSDQKSTVAPE